MPNDNVSHSGSRSTEKKEWVTIRVNPCPHQRYYAWVTQELVGHTYTDDPERKFFEASSFKTRVLYMRIENDPQSDDQGKLINVFSSK